MDTSNNVLEVTESSKMFDEVAVGLLATSVDVDKLVQEVGGVGSLHEAHQSAIASVLERLETICTRHHGIPSL